MKNMSTESENKTKASQANIDPINMGSFGDINTRTVDRYKVSARGVHFILGILRCFAQTQQAPETESINPVEIQHA